MKFTKPIENKRKVDYLIEAAWSKLKEDYDESPEGHEGLIDALRYLLVYLFHDKNNHITISGGF